MLVMRPIEISWHSARITALCQTDTSAAIETAPDKIADGAKALAMTALDFLCDAGLRERTRASFGAA